MPLRFSYGTLQQEDVQLSTFGRRLAGQSDELLGVEPSLVRIEDPQVVATDAELASVDEYELAFFYKRVAVMLASGRQAWVYAHARCAPDGS